MGFQERQFVPVPALEGDLAVAKEEEAAAAETERVAPFKDGAFGVLKEVFDDTDHPGGGELAAEHVEDGLPAVDRFVGDLVVDGIRQIEFGEGDGIATIEGLDPGEYKLLG